MMIIRSANGSIDVTQKQTANNEMPFKSASTHQRPLSAWYRLTDCVCLFCVTVFADCMAKQGLVCVCVVLAKQGSVSCDQYAGGQKMTKLFELLTNAHRWFCKLLHTLGIFKLMFVQFYAMVRTSQWIEKGAKNHKDTLNDYKETTPELYISSDSVIGYN